MVAKIPLELIGEGLLLASIVTAPWVYGSVEDTARYALCAVLLVAAALFMWPELREGRTPRGVGIAFVFPGFALTWIALVSLWREETRFDEATRQDHGQVSVPRKNVSPFGLGQNRDQAIDGGPNGLTLPAQITAQLGGPQMRIEAGGFEENQLPKQFFNPSGPCPALIPETPPRPRRRTCRGPHPTRSGTRGAWLPAKHGR